jgi:hypothetical protein
MIVQGTSSGVHVSQCFEKKREKSQKNKTGGRVYTKGRS